VNYRPFSAALYGDKDSYQYLPREQRLQITINRSPVVEIDVTASHLTILHGFTNYPIDLTRDPYEVEGFDREIIKAWVTATLGKADRHLERWPQGQSKEYREKNGRTLSEVAPMRKVREAVEARHSLFTDWGQLPFPDWGMLQFRESEAFIRTMLELADEDIPSLPVHDSLIVRADDQERAKATLSKAYEEICKIRPLIKVVCRTPAEAP
jgi:hypothetical protein